VNLENTNSELYQEVKRLIVDAQRRVYVSSNAILLKLYWDIGQQIVEIEQDGKERAAYGKSVLKNLSEQLSLDFGKGFDASNLRNMRQFYLAFQKWDAVRHKLSWTHYRILSRIEEEEERNAYTLLADKENWNTRELQRNKDSMYLGRMLEKPTENAPQVESEIIKDPYIFEFLGIKEDTLLKERDLESGLLAHIKSFLMEMGKGFAFVESQQHVVTDTSDFYIDLVFYNYHLKCFVLVDLKTTKLTHQAIGQMDMYVRMYDDLKRPETDNPTIGLVLCTEKDETIVKYSVLAENKKLFASKYRLYLPKEEELKELIERDRQQIELKNDKH
jgi:predicted nuclease of restriction endonuclease-like (RecB) superfamily